MGRRAHGLPLGSRRRLIVISVALVVTLIGGLIFALQERPPGEPLQQVAFLVERGHLDGDIDDDAHRELDGEIERLAEAVDERRWDDALLAVDDTRVTLQDNYDEGRVEVALARRIVNALDDLEHAVQGARDGAGRR